MKTELSLIRIAKFSVFLALPLPAAKEPSGDLRAALERAGGNRAELEAALLEVKGKNTEYLIAHASQYDLVNLTSQQIIQNITYARKVHDEALPYLGEKLEYEMWREWVLPHRVLDEDLCVWRKDFYDRMQPVIAGKLTTAEVVEAIHEWLVVQGKEAPQLVFDLKAGGRDERQLTPLQLLKAGTGACGELCMIHVYLLRAVGIPARHCSLGHYTSRDDGHLYCEYWDPQLGEWTAVDASVERRLDVNPPRVRVETGAWSSLAMYAYPGLPRNPDLYQTAFWDQCVPVTGNLMVPNRVEVAVSDEAAEVMVTANVWNQGVWRATARVAGEGGRVTLALAKIAPTDRPVLFAAVTGEGALHWSVEHPKMDGKPIRLRRAEAGQCIVWPMN